MKWEGFSCRVHKKNGSVVVNRQSVLEGDELNDIEKIVLTPRDEALNKKIEIYVTPGSRISFVKRITATVAELASKYSQATYIVRVQQNGADISYHINMKGEVTITNDFQKVVR